MYVCREDLCEEHSQSKPEPRNNRSETDRILLSDRLYLVLMVIAVAAAGYMSICGALEIFSGKYALAVGFGIVVQGLIFAALWELPRRGVLWKALCLLLWMMATLFSVSAAYYAADQNNMKDDVEVVRREVTNYFGKVSEKIANDERNANFAEKLAQAERDKGIHTNGAKGEGPNYLRLTEAALQARSSADQVSAYKTIIAEATSKLNHPGLQLSDVSDVFASVNSKLGGYATDIPPPNFERDRRSFFSRIAVVVTVVFRMKTEMSAEKRASTLYTLVVSSLMEILAFGIALLRLFKSRPIDDRLFPERLAAGLSTLGTLGAVPQIAVEMTKTNRLRMSNSLSRNRAHFAPHQPQSGEETERCKAWDRAIQAQADMMGHMDQKELIENLLPDESALSQLGSRGNTGRRSLFDARLFDGNKAIIAVALITGVIESTKKGFEPGRYWDEWTTFLMRKYTEIMSTSRVEEMSNKRPRSSNWRAA